MSEPVVNRGKTTPNGTASTPARESKIRPRRLVLLAGGEDSVVEGVLAEYTGLEGRGKDVHGDIERHAAEHPGRFVAAEWFSALGWTRFLWCRKQTS